MGMKKTTIARICCTVCASNRIDKHISVFNNISICKNCIKSNNQLSKLIKINKEVNDSININIEDKKDHNEKFMAMFNLEVEKTLVNYEMKKEIFEKVKKFNVVSSSQKKINSVLNTMEPESLKSVVETIRETKTVEDFRQRTEIKKIKESLTIPDPKEIFKRLSLRIIDQDEAVKSISMAVTKHFCRIQDPSLKKNNIMIMGPTGTGKTELVKALSKEIDIPIISLDASTFTASGYKGMNVSDSIINAITNATKNSPSMSKKCIVFLDEIDKKASSHNSEHGISTTIVQQELLTMLQGDVIRNDKVEIDTSNILVIAAGAFAGLVDIVNKRKNKKSIGLANQLNDEIKGLESSIYKDVSTKDLIDYGLIPEFIGRFSTITYTKSLSKSGLVKVLSTKRDSIAEEYVKMFKSMKVNLKFSPEFLNTIAEEAINLQLGARGLNRVIDSKMESIIFDIYDYIGESIEVTADGKVKILSK